MVELRPATPAEIPAQKALWQLVFGDSPETIDSFYRRCAACADMIVLTEDGVLRSMLALLPMTLELPDGGTARAYYIYALATDPHARGQGFGRQLLNYADFYLREKGADCVTVVPAEISLHRFFGMVGFSECFATRKRELTAAMVVPSAPEDTIAPISPAEYGVLREQALAGQAHMKYSDALLGYQADLSHLEGGDLYRIAANGHTGCAAAEYFDRESVLLKELLIAPCAMPRAMAQLRDAL
ncbi:MAG: GNAT family N-acetyltransferase, partial [Pseudoflavonifractor sp.]